MNLLTLAGMTALALIGCPDGGGSNADPDSDSDSECDSADSGCSDSDNDNDNDSGDSQETEPVAPSSAETWVWVYWDDTGMRVQVHPYYDDIRQVLTFASHDEAFGSFAREGDEWFIHAADIPDYVSVDDTHIWLQSGLSWWAETAGGADLNPKYEFIDLRSSPPPPPPPGGHPLFLGGATLEQQGDLWTGEMASYCPEPYWLVTSRKQGLQRDLGRFDATKFALAADQVPLCSEGVLEATAICAAPAWMTAAFGPDRLGQFRRFETCRDE